MIDPIVTCMGLRHKPKLALPIGRDGMTVPNFYDLSFPVYGIAVARDKLMFICMFSYMQNFQS